jgi:SAM-dependent methyltransferase
MVKRATFRLRRFGDRVRVWQGDTTAIDADDDAYDAVFDFGIIHHVPDWAAALAEVARVLRTGGRFFFEEVTRHALERPIYRTLFDHPAWNRFTSADFQAGLQSAGLIVDEQRELLFGDFILGVAHRPEPLGEQAVERTAGAIHGTSPVGSPVSSSRAEGELDPCL